VAPLATALNVNDAATYGFNVTTAPNLPVFVTVTAAAPVGATSITVAALSGAIPLISGTAATVLDFRKSQWYEFDVFNNIIVDNSSADHGGGLSLDNTVNSFVVNNTIANNDSTSTAAGAFSLTSCTDDDAEGQFCPNLNSIEIGGAAGYSVSVPQVGGIASFAHGSDLLSFLIPGAFCTAHPYNAVDPATYPCATFANPVLEDNIIWHNRSFYWDSTINNNQGGLVEIPVRNGYWDMAVYGLPTPTGLNPVYSILTDGVGGNTGVGNLLGVSPGFVTQCDQPFLDNLQCQDPTKALAAPITCQPPFSVCQGFDIYQATEKGAALGNFVATTFTPNGLGGDYHTGKGSPAIDAGGYILPGDVSSKLPLLSTSPALLTTDIDGKPRPLGNAADIGANEQLVANTASNANFPLMQVLQPIPPAVLDFGTVTLFQPTQRTVTIINQSQLNLIVAGASTDSPQFNVINWTGLTTLVPGATMDITVSYTPAAITPAVQQAHLTIVSNATQNQTATVALQGNGK
jgi:hypothetical protein